MSRQSSKSFSSCRGYKDVGLGAQQVRRKLTNQISPSVKEIEQDYGRVFSEKDQLIADIRGMQRLRSEFEGIQDSKGFAEIAEAVQLVVAAVERERGGRRLSPVALRNVRGNAPDFSSDPGRQRLSFADVLLVYGNAVQENRRWDETDLDMSINEAMREALDTNGDGSVDGEELVRWLDLLSIRVDPGVADQFLRDADADGNGDVDYMELASAIAFRGHHILFGGHRLGPGRASEGRRSSGRRSSGAATRARG